MSKFLSIILVIIVLSTPVFAACRTCNVHAQSKLAKKCIISSKPRNKNNVRGNVGANYNVHGQYIGTYRIKGKRVVAYDKDGHRMGYYKRLSNGKIAKYNRYGKMVASY